MEQYRKYVLLFVKLILILFALFFMYIFFARLIFYLLPFLIGWLLAFIINPVVNLAQKKTGIPRGIVSAFMLLLFFFLLSLMVFFGASRLVTELNNILNHLPQYRAMVENTVNNIVSRGQDIYFALPPHFTELVQERAALLDINSLIDTMTKALSSGIRGLLSYISILPRTMLSFIVVIITAFFISKDMEMIKNFFIAQIPKNAAPRLKSIETDLLKALAGFIKAQLTLMAITFAITSTGLYIIGVPYALTIAIIIGLVDALPILGTGAILIPWAVISIFMGNLSRGIALLVLYSVIITTRQMIEPKIVGKGLGLHPLVTLASLYIGIQVFGITGVILGPLTVIIIKALQKAEIIPGWKKA